jgi:hypothetical protein
MRDRTTTYPPAPRPVPSDNPNASKPILRLRVFASRQQPVQELPAALPACETPPWE